MSIHTLLGATPPARGDGVPWSEARIEEAALAAGPFVEVDVVALAPLDADPVYPGARSLTFSAPADVAWYRIRWADADGGVSPPTSPVYDEPDVAPLPLEPEARANLERMVAADTEPVLGAAEIDQLLVLARRADAADRAPADAGWEPTYDLRAAAAEGWRWKAGKVSDRFAFQADGEKVDRDQVLAHCLKMASLYAARVGVLPLRRTVADSGLPAGLEGWGPLLGGAQGPTHDGPPYVSPLALPGAAERGDSTA